MSSRAEQLHELIARSEDSLIRRVLAYAQANGFTRYTSTLAEAWRASIAGLSQPILIALETSDEVCELSPDAVFTSDPIAAFGILEAQRHRSRGVAIGMFLGLMKYYRQSYTDLIEEAGFPPDTQTWAQLYVARTFDRIELGYCTEWSSESPAEHAAQLRAANLELANEKNKYLTLFSSLAPPILLLDRDDRVTDMNFAAEHLFLGSESPGQSYYGVAVRRLLPGTLAAALEAFRDDLRPQLHTTVSFGEGNERRDYDVLIHRMLDVSGKFTGTTLLLSDITLRLKLQYELREARDVLEDRVADRTRQLEVALDTLRHESEERERAAAAQRHFEDRLREGQRLESLGVLAGGVAHDFNNLLTTILGNADLVRCDLPEDSPGRERLEAVSSASRHAADLCKQMLAYSGGGQIGREDMDLSGLVMGMTDLLHASVPRSIALRFTPGSAAGSVFGDASQLRQVALNLVGNAAEAIGDRHGSIEISVDRVHCSRADLDATLLGLGLAEGDYVTLSVRDDGCGMDAETRARVFDPFFTTKFVGRGLGLAVVHGIVRGHGGTIGLISQPGAGTTVQVFLPALLTPCRAEPAAATHQSGAAQHASAAGTVLLVDDDPMVRSVTSQMLRADGWDVVEASDGIEAIATWAAHKDRITRIVMDVTMPGMDGPSALEAMREAGCTAPAILITGYDESEVAKRSKGLGVTAVVHKPFTHADLTGTLSVPCARRIGEARPLQ